MFNTTVSAPVFSNNAVMFGTRKKVKNVVIINPNDQKDTDSVSVKSTDSITTRNIKGAINVLARSVANLKEKLTKQKSELDALVSEENNLISRLAEVRRQKNKLNDSIYKNESTHQTEVFAMTNKEKDLLDRKASKLDNKLHDLKKGDSDYKDWVDIDNHEYKKTYNNGSSVSGSPSSTNSNSSWTSISSWEIKKNLKKAVNVVTDQLK